MLDRDQVVGVLDLHGPAGVLARGLHRVGGDDRIVEGQGF